MTNVRDLLAAADLRPTAPVRWGSKPSIDSPGVYLVSTSEDPDADSGLGEIPVDAAAVRTLIAARPEAMVDGIQATENSVIGRLGRLWVPGEPVVYVGLAGTSVAMRVSQYYSTRIGARGPHAGGWPLKMLRDLDQLWVHSAPCVDPGAAENMMLLAFATGCDAAARSTLHDPDVLLPYANLELTKGLRKRHGFTGVKERRSKSEAAPGRPARLPTVAPATAAAAPRPLVTGSALRTQNITAADIAKGQIRVPSRTKRLLPTDKSQIEIELCGTRMTGRWDPKYGPDKERSGVIAVGKAAMAPLVRPCGPMKVTTEDGIVRIG